MTMLDRMRRHKGWLKWSLALVVLTFVVFYIPDFLATSPSAAPSEVVAEVEGADITVRDFQRRYAAQLQAYRNAYGAQMSEQLLRQLGIEQQILQQLVDEEAMVAEARRQGISVSDVEIRERILAIPAFQENGRFIGEARYRQMLQFNNPPMTTTEFEDSLRRALLVEKLRNADHRLDVGQPTRRSREEYRRRNEKVKLDVVPLTPDAFRSQVTVTDADVAALFRGQQGDLPRRREAQGPLRARRRRSHPRANHRCQRPRSSAFYQQNHGAVLDAGTGARQPHPAQDRRQGRSRGQGAGRGGAQAGQGGRGFRGAGEGVLGGRQRTTRRAATSITSGAARWCRSSSRRRSR